MNVLPVDQQVQAIAALSEGCSIRATERLTGIHRDTIMRLSKRVGDGCDELHSRTMRGLNVALLQLDEQWAFVGKKQKRVNPFDPTGTGDCYLFVALDSISKAVVSYRVGKRDAENTQEFLSDLRERVVNRPQITSDGFPAYPEAVDLAFSKDVDFAVLRKNYYGDPGPGAARRYSPAHIIGADRKIWNGRPRIDKISTSHVERFNLTTRMQSRRMTRLTSGFSKKWENHAAAMALHIAVYNFCRVHEAVRVTPAMQLGVTGHIWSIAELLERVAVEPQPTPPVTPTGIDLTVIRGGWKRVSH